MPRINSGGWKSGDVRIWSGTLDDIPSGWELATDMIDRAVVGAGGAYSKGQQFGADNRTPNIYVSNHTLSTSCIPSHNHSYVKATNVTNHASTSSKTQIGATASASSGSAGSSGAHKHGASSSAIDTRQKSIAVIWIRKL